MHPLSLSFSRLRLVCNLIIGFMSSVLIEIDTQCKHVHVYASGCQFVLKRRAQVRSQTLAGFTSIASESVRLRAISGRIRELIRMFDAEGSICVASPTCYLCAAKTSTTASPRLLA